MALKPSMRVIVVDDVLQTRKMISTSMKNMGFKNVDEADDGKTAWEKIESAYKEGKPYEFILSDWKMNEMSGLDLLKLVRSTEAIKKTPFMIVTDEAKQVDVMKVIKAGASNFIVKPFTPDILKQKIAQVLK